MKNKIHQLSLDEIHEKETYMLKLVSELCDKHGIRYYICGGTLLGAVRHKGFIPWDDDVDILLPRPDYDKLQEIIKTQPFMPKYRFHSSDLGNLYDPMCKLFDLETIVDKTYIDDEYDRYLWIDMFPMDGMPESEAELETMYRKIHAARKRLKFMKAKNGTGRSSLKKIIKPVLKPFALLLFGKKRTVRYIEKIAKRYKFEETETVGGLVFGYGPQERMNREEYVKPVKMEFEGLTVTAPGCYDEYLRALFGNYMELPPEDKRQVHFMKIYGR